MAQTKEGALLIAAKKAGLTLDEYITLSAVNKKCTQCKQWQNKNCFNADKSRHDCLSSKCQTCTRVKERKSLKGRVSTFKGKKHTEEAKRKNAESQKRNGFTRPMLGKKHTFESRQKMSQTRRERNIPHGEQCHSYKDGKCQERRGVRFSKEYKQWRYDVFLRDKFTCQKCGDAKGGNLNAHHIKPFAECPELRFEISNGITLCEDCHKQEHAAG
jgi:5-methylcytosine-specific restriction endonuclease McrA